MMKSWEEEWVNSRDYGHTKKFWAKPDLKRSSEMRKLTREQHGRTSRFYVNFNYTRAFKAKINRDISPYCQFCLELGREVKEDAYHVLYECPRWEVHRREVFEDFHQEPLKYNPKRVAKFLGKEEIRQLEENRRPP